MKEKFEISVSKPDTFVGIEIKKQEGELFMGQSSYIKSSLMKYNLNDAYQSQ